MNYQTRLALCALAVVSGLVFLWWTIWPVIIPAIKVSAALALIGFGRWNWPMKAKPYRGGIR